MTKREEILQKELKALTNHILRIKKECEAQQMWLSLGRTKGLPLDVDHQQGPMVTKLFTLAEKAKEVVKSS